MKPATGCTRPCASSPGCNSPRPASRRRPSSAVPRTTGWRRCWPRPGAGPSCSACSGGPAWRSTTSAPSCCAARIAGTWTTGSSWRSGWPGTGSPGPPPKACAGWRRSSRRRAVTRGSAPGGISCAGFLAVLKAVRPPPGPAAARRRRGGQGHQAAGRPGRSAGHGLGRGEHGRPARRSPPAAGRGSGGQRRPGLPVRPDLVLQARALSGFTEADLDTVRSASAEALWRAEQIGDRYGQGIMLLNLALADLAGGSPAGPARGWPARCGWPANSMTGSPSSA